MVETEAPKGWKGERSWTQITGKENISQWVGGEHPSLAVFKSSLDEVGTAKIPSPFFEV